MYKNTAKSVLFHYDIVKLKLRNLKKIIKQETEKLKP